MRCYFLAFISVLFSTLSFAQSVVPIRGDTVRIYKVGGNAELKVENATRSRTGAFLKNTGNGWGQWAYALDSVQVAGDSLRFRYGTGYLAVKVGGSGTAGIDTLIRSGDSIYFRKTGITYTLGKWLSQSAADALYAPVGTTTSSVAFNTATGVQTFTKANGSTYSVDLDGRYVEQQAQATLTDGATITWDFSTGEEKAVTIAGNRTLSITNLPAGKVAYGTLAVTQDATGGRTLTLPAGSKVVNGGGGAVTLTITGGATDILVFRWTGTILQWVTGKNFN